MRIDKTVLTSQYTDPENRTHRVVELLNVIVKVPPCQTIIQRPLKYGECTRKPLVVGIILQLIAGSLNS